MNLFASRMANRFYRPYAPNTSQKTSSLWKRGSKREWDTLIYIVDTGIGCIGLATLDRSLVMMPKSIARGDDMCQPCSATDVIWVQRKRLAQ